MKQCKECKKQKKADNCIECAIAAENKSKFNHDRYMILKDKYNRLEKIVSNTKSIIEKSEFIIQGLDMTGRITRVMHKIKESLNGN